MTLCMGCGGGGGGEVDHALWRVRGPALEDMGLLGEGMCWLVVCDTVSVVPPGYRGLVMAGL